MRGFGASDSLAGQGLPDGHAQLFGCEGDADYFRLAQGGCEIEGCGQRFHERWGHFKGACLLYIALKRPLLSLGMGKKRNKTGIFSAGFF